MLPDLGGNYMMEPKTVVVVDGVANKPIDGEVSDFQFSDDGRHYAFHTVSPHNAPSRIYIDGIELNYTAAGGFCAFKYVRSDTILAITVAPARKVELQLIPKPVGESTSK